MSRILLAGFIICLTCSLAMGQQTPDTITINKSLYVKDGIIYSLNELPGLVSTCRNAVELARKAKNQNITATIFAGIGGACVGWPIGTFIGGGEPEWNLVVVGAAFIGIGIPLSVCANKNARRAVELYNRETSPHQQTDIRLNIGFTPGGIGLALQF